VQSGSIKALLFDIEGTIAFQGTPIPGAPEALAEVKRRGLPVRFLTNIDSRSPATVAQELRAMGLAVISEEIFSAARAAYRFLQQQPRARCYGLLPLELRELFAPYLVTEGKVDYVLIGDCRQVASYQTLNTAFHHLVNGANLLALQKGRYFVDQGTRHLDTGAFVQLLEYASGQQALVLGKPTPEFFRAAVEAVGCVPEEIAVVGDDVTTDIVGAKALGICAVLVRTGKYQYQADIALPVQPDVIIDSVASIPAWLDGTLATA
jgi:HAD superfamily hydrolase (TIGR01458 family)